MGENIVEEIVKEVEEEFKPKPGGMVDTYRKDKARREEGQRERENVDEPVEEMGYRAVKVSPISPDGFTVNVINIPAGGNAQVLSNSPYRSRATITVITPASTVVLAKDAGAALSGVGFPFASTATGPSAQPLVLNGRGQLYGSSATAIQVAVISELYGPVIPGHNV